MMILRFFALALLGSLLTGCGSDPADIDADQDADNGQAASESTPKSSSDIIPMTAEDGWADLHDLSLPESGQAWLDIEGERVEFEIECDGPGVIDHSGEVPRSLGSRLFNAEFTGEAMLANGRRVKIQGSRYVLTERAVQANLLAYSYRGMDGASLEFNVYDQEGMAHGSIQGGPSSQNRAGKGLPMLHVQPDGSFTATTELISKASYIPDGLEYHQHALAGPVTLAGRCPVPWEELPPPRW